MRPVLLAVLGISALAIAPLWVAAGCAAGSENPASSHAQSGAGTRGTGGSTGGQGGTGGDSTGGKSTGGSNTGGENTGGGGGTGGTGGDPCVPSRELCDGQDNDCNGVIDDDCNCKDGDTTECFTGDLSTLGVGVCHGGTMTCDLTGTYGPCVGEVTESAEVCNGLDDDCDGTEDDGLGQTTCGQGACTVTVDNCIAGVPQVCVPLASDIEKCNGLDDNCDGQVDEGCSCIDGQMQACYTGGASTLGVGACHGGTQLCAGGVWGPCNGQQLPVPEICNAIDDNCDGAADEGLGTQVCGVGGCQVTTPNCVGGNPQVCTPGQPVAETCNNVDDDCNGQIDDGLGTIGCGVGACAKTVDACTNGMMGVCVPGLSSPEICDSIDNDCDGMIDNENPAGRLALCAAPGSSCVKASSGCLCAVPCGDGEFPCPVGQKCEQVTSSQTGQELGGFCVSDSCNGDCTPQKVLGPNDTVICAPDGTPADDNCVKPPVCVCKGGQDGCKNPCFGVVCGVGSVCPDYGPKKGTCVQDNCYNNPCQGCGRICVGGTCIDGPCKPDSCPATEECKPSADFLSFTCVPPCGDLQCPSGKACVDGVCVDSCDPPCAANQVCDKSKSPPTCVPNLCDPNPCTDGSYCDPITGNCGNYPCTGIICPGDTTCTEGECTKLPAPMTTSSSATGAGGGGSGAGGGGGSSAKGVWGLATGGGGCACEVGPGASRWDGARWALVAAALAVSGLRRRNRKRESR